MKGTPDGDSVVWEEEVTLLSGLQRQVFCAQADGAHLQKTLSKLANAEVG